ncbi:MAG: hypothetical protein ACR2IE_10745 [Candidatus Sumerlaeaceae bacterium]
MRLVFRSGEDYFYAKYRRPKPEEGTELVSGRAPLSQPRIIRMTRMGMRATVSMGMTV